MDDTDHYTIEYVEHVRLYRIHAIDKAGDPSYYEGYTDVETAFYICRELMELNNVSETRYIQGER